MLVPDRDRWPDDPADLAREQDRLARERPDPWVVPEGTLAVGGCAVVAAPELAPAPPGHDVGVAAAVIVEMGRHAPALVETDRACVVGALRNPFTVGLLARREGPLLEAAVSALSRRPEVILVHAAGRDHPRHAGLASMLGAVLRIPSVGVTTRPLRASGPPPGEERGALGPLILDGEVVAYWVRTRAGARPIVAHAGWRTTPRVAAEIVLMASLRARLPEPLRRALEVARLRRSERPQSW